MSDPRDPFRDDPRDGADDVEHTRPLAHGAGGGEGTGDGTGDAHRASPPYQHDQHAGYPAPGQQTGTLPARPGRHDGTQDGPQDGPQDGYAAFGAPLAAPGEDRAARRRAERERRRADRA
ncbi:hypothetical protein, partial [Nocardioides sp. ChNu-99]|uniref:hypothetical protein n=1 Tax=Nocardioides sp. ChNu-99 TaxID=2839897 RepID=UPI002407349D